MCRVTRLGRSLLLTAVLFATGSARADLERGMMAVEKRDWPAALGEFQPLAERGNPDAQVNLGNLYMKGYGVDQDYHVAFRWYLKAAKQGSAVGQGKLGLMLYYGLGVHENRAEAAGWFREAAAQGDAGAASILGLLYASGDGVEKDKVQAYVWYSVAADHGHREAWDSREGLVDEMSPGEIDEALTRLAAWRKQYAPAIEADTDSEGATPDRKPVVGGRHKKGEKPTRTGSAKPPKPVGKAVSPNTRKNS